MIDGNRVRHLALEPITDDPQANRTASSDPAAPAAGGVSGPAATGAAGDPPGLRAQLRATRDAVVRLVRAHVDLAKAELQQIAGQVARTAALAGIALAAVLFVGVLLPVGLALFLGEWLFGSIGWGVLLGTVFMVAVAVIAVLAALGAPGATLARNLVVAVVLGLVVGVLLALHLPNQAWASLGETLGLDVDPGLRPLVVGVLVLAIVCGVVGLVLGGAGGAALPGLIGGLIIGAVVGAFSAISFGVQPGAALGVLVGLTAWPVLSGAAVAKDGIDLDALKARFWPQVTIDTAKETIEWVRAQTPLGPTS